MTKKTVSKFQAVMDKRTLYLISGILTITSILVQLLLFGIRPDVDSISNISIGILGMGLTFLLFAIFKKEKK
jgi:hypothetical protein